MPRIEELNRKEVINIRDGVRLGFVSDVEVDIKTGHVVAVIVQGGCKILCVFGKDVEYIIPWCKIETIGEDIIIVNIDVNKVMIER